MKALLAVALVTALPAQAISQNCVSGEAAIARLTDKYGESQVFAGLTPTGEMVAIYMSPTTHTWTALVFHANGAACAVAVGNNGEVSMPLEPIPGSVN